MKMRITQYRYVSLATAVVAAVCVFAPSTVRAEGFLSPYVGVNFGGDTDVKTTVFGGSVGAISGGGIGFEVDFGYAPDFFDTEEFIGAKTSVTTLMGNVIFAPASRGAGARPYVSGGLGLMRTSLDVSDLFENVDRNDFALNAGGGLFIDLSRNFAVRGDIRYFRSLRGEDSTDDSVLPDFGFDLADFSFWRATAGASFKF